MWTHLGGQEKMREIVLDSNSLNDRPPVPFSLQFRKTCPTVHLQAEEVKPHDPDGGLFVTIDGFEWTGENGICGCPED